MISIMMTDSHRQIILLDLDDTFFDTENYFLELYEIKYPHLPVIPFEKRDTWLLEEQYPAECRDAIRTIYRMKGFYRNVPPFPGAVQAVQELGELADVFLCSAHQRDYENCVLEKCEAIHEHLGKDWIRKTILTKDKTLIYGDKLVDDNPTISGKRKPSWEHILYTRPWNRSVTDKRHLDWTLDWKSVLDV
jgi:5'-nucleotidase